jgi:hypothetical protein
MPMKSALPPARVRSACIAPFIRPKAMTVRSVTSLIAALRCTANPGGVSIGGISMEKELKVPASVLMYSTASVFTIASTILFPSP